MTTAALIDDHAVFRQGLRLLFEQHGDPLVVGEASSAADALEIVSAARPDVVVLDMVLGKGMDGVALAQQLLQRTPSQRILFLSMVKDVCKVAGALESGGRGYATKDQSVEELIDAVRTVAAGGHYLGSTLARERVEEQRHLLRTNPPTGDLASLTIRERQIFELTVAGLTAAAIGDRLSISRRTVETHRARILGKCGVHSAMDLVRIAARAGLL